MFANFISKIKAALTKIYSKITHWKLQGILTGVNEINMVLTYVTDYKGQKDGYEYHQDYHPCLKAVPCSFHGWN